MDHSIYGMLQVSEILKKQLQLLSNVDKRKSCPIPCLLTEIHITGYGSEIWGASSMIYFLFATVIYGNMSMLRKLCIMTESEVTQSCQSLCDPMDYSLSGSSIHGIFQARVLEWVAISFAGYLSDPGIKPRFPALQVDAFTL